MPAEIDGVARNKAMQAYTRAIRGGAEQRAAFTDAILAYEAAKAGDGAVAWVPPDAMECLTRDADNEVTAWSRPFAGGVPLYATPPAPAAPAAMVALLKRVKAFHDRDSGSNGFTADYECLRLEIDAALASATDAKDGAEVTGFKLVPTEPTPKMLEDAAFNLADEFGADFVKPLGAFAKAVYAELLAAAPKPTPPASEASHDRG